MQEVQWPRRHGLDVGDWARDGGLEACLARRVRTHPDWPAIVHGEAVLTYRELWSAAGETARQLKGLGFGSGDRAALRIERSPALGIALVGCLRAAVTSMVESPQWSDPLRKTLASDLQLGALITADVRTGRIDVGAHPLQSAESDIGQAGGGGGGGALLARDGWERPLAIVFTSGSTGTPKAVQVPERAVRRLLGDPAVAPFRPGWRFGLAAPAVWDAFILEFWAPLLTGGVVVMAVDASHSPEGIRDLSARHGIHALWLTASLFNLIIDQDPGCLAVLDCVVTGGEQMSPRHARRFLDACPATRLINGYGPVESTVFATTHAVSQLDVAAQGPVPVGRPVSGTAVHVVVHPAEGGSDAICPLGTVGEIVLTGEGLVPGYLNAPEPSATRFAPLRLGTAALPAFRTSDMGWFDATGCLRVLGRSDSSVKLNGRLLDLARLQEELERLVSPSGQIRVVPVRDDLGICSGIVVAVVPAGGRGSESTGTAGAVPDFPAERMAERLADDLAGRGLAARLLVLGSWPLTLTGKLDARAIVDQAMVQAPVDGGVPDRPQAGPPEGPLAHGTPLLPVILDQVRELSGHPDVGPDVAFARSGLTSLSLIALASRLGVALGRPVRLSTLVQASTPAALAHLLGGVAGAPSPGAGRAAARAPARQPLGALEVGFLARTARNPADTATHCLACWVMEGPVCTGALQRSLDAVCQDEPVLTAIATFEPEHEPSAPAGRQPKVIALAPAPDRAAALASVREVLLGPLDPFGGCNLRLALCTFGDGEGAVLGLCVHHVAWDAASLSVFAARLSRAYAEAAGPGDRGGARFGPPARPVLVRAADWSAPSPEVADQSRALARMAPVRWPAAGPRQTGRGLPRQRIDLSAAHRIESRLRREGVLFAELALAAWGVALHRVTGSTAVCIGCPIDMGPDPDTSDRRIGCHVQMMAVELSDLTGVDSLLGTGAVRAAIRTAAAAPCASRLPAPRDWSASHGPSVPFPYQSVVAIQSRPPPRLALGQAVGRWHWIEPGGALVDLAVEVWPAEPAAIGHPGTARAASAVGAGMDIVAGHDAGRVPARAAEAVVRHFRDELISWGGREWMPH